MGKTTIAVHLALALIEKDKRVLFIEVDPQRNATRSLAAYASGVVASQLFDDESLETPEGGGNLILIEADAKMADMERAPTQPQPEGKPPGRQIQMAHSS